VKLGFLGEEARGFFVSGHLQSLPKPLPQPLKLSRLSLGRWPRVNLPIYGNIVTNESLGTRIGSAPFLMFDLKGTFPTTDNRQPKTENGI